MGASLLAVTKSIYYYIKSCDIIVIAISPTARKRPDKLKL